MLQSQVHTGAKGEGEGGNSSVMEADLVLVVMPGLTVAPRKGRAGGMAVHSHVRAFV